MVVTVPPRLAGRIVRTLEQTPTLVHERFWLDTGPRTRPYETVAGWKELDQIGTSPVEGQPAGPLLLWDEVVGRRDQLESLTHLHIGGNLAAWTPPALPLDRNAAGLEPLQDAEFWRFIEVLQGRMWEKTIRAATAELSQCDEDFILRWQETCARNALALTESLDDPIEEYGHDAFHILGAVIGKGKEAFESILVDWASWDPRWITDHSQTVLHLGSIALERKLKCSVQVGTSFTPTHVRILESADAVDDVAHEEAQNRAGLGRDAVENALGPDPDLESVADFVQLRGEELSAEGWAATREALHPPHFRGLSANLTMQAGRALIEDGGSIRMRIVLADVTSVLPPAVLSTIAEALTTFGGSICSEIEADRSLWGGPLDGDLFTIKRRFRGTREDYLARFVSG